MTCEQILWPESRAEAVNAIDRYLIGGHEVELSKLLLGIETYENGQAFALMRGSGNDMTAFEKFLSVLFGRGLITRDEAVRYVLSATGGGQL